MPIVIDEVVISVEVTNKASGRDTKPAKPAEDRQAVVQECVERVLEILERKAER